METMEFDDIDLIQQTLDGNQQAFTKLVEKYQKQLHALAWQKIGDFHIAQDIVQETFLSAYQKLEQLEHPNQFVGWLYVITSNKCKNWKRKKKIPLQSIETINSTELEEAYYKEYMTTQREEARNRKNRKLVQTLLNKLKESDRTIVNLFYIAELTCEDIGKFLGISPNTVRSRLHRARNQMKKEVAIIQENLSSFQLPAQLTDNIMQEISKLKPATPFLNKPLFPLAISTVTALIISLIIGVGIHNLSQFQRPYNLSAQSESSIEIVDAQIILDLPQKSPLPVLVTGTKTPNTVISQTQEQNDSGITANTTDAIENPINKQQLVQGKGPEGGLINTFYESSQGDIFAGTPTSLYKLSDNHQSWKLVQTWSTSSLPHYNQVIGGIGIVEQNGKLYLPTYDEILVSIDEGETWDKLGSHPKGLPVDLAITDAGFYIVLKNAVYWSENGTKPWVSLNHGIEEKKIIELAAVNNTVFAATSNGLYRLNDGMWGKLAIDPTEEANKVEYIHAIAASNNKLYVAVGDVFTVKNRDNSNDSWYTLYKSTDLGNTWNDIHLPNNTANTIQVEDSSSINYPPNGTKVEIESNITAHTLHVKDRSSINYPPNDTKIEIESNINITVKDRLVVIILPNKIIYSNDEGTTWKNIESNIQSNNWIPPPVLMTDTQTIYSGGKTGIYRTTDDGKIWHSFNHGFKNTIVQKLIGSNNNLYASTNEDIFWSADGGENWKQLPIKAKDISYIAVFNNTLYMKTYDYKMPLYQFDTNRNIVTPIPKMPNLKQSVNTNRIVLNAISNQDKKDKKIASPEDMSIAELNKNLNMAFPHQTLNAPIPLLGSFAVNGDQYYVEYGKRLLKWNPGLTEWIDTGIVDTSIHTPRPFLPQKSIGSMKELASSNPFTDHTSLKIAVSGNNVYVCNSKGQFFESLDEGETWNDLTDNLPFSVGSYNSLVFAGNTLYAATNKGVIWSRNGIVWHTVMGTEESDLVIQNLSVDGTTVYGQVDQQIYTLKKESNKWQLITEEIPYQVSSIAANNNTLYVATIGGGVLRYEINQAN